MQRCCIIFSSKTIRALCFHNCSPVLPDKRGGCWGLRVYSVTESIGRAESPHRSSSFDTLTAHAAVAVSSFLSRTERPYSSGNERPQCQGLEFSSCRPTHSMPHRFLLNKTHSSFRLLLRCAHSSFRFLVSDIPEAFSFV